MQTEQLVISVVDQYKPVLEEAVDSFVANGGADTLHAVQTGIEESIRNTEAAVQDAVEEWNERQGMRSPHSPRGPPHSPRDGMGPPGKGPRPPGKGGPPPPGMGGPPMPRPPRPPGVGGPPPPLGEWGAPEPPCDDTRWDCFRSTSQQIRDYLDTHVAALIGLIAVSCVAFFCLCGSLCRMRNSCIAMRIRCARHHQRRQDVALLHMSSEKQTQAHAELPTYDFRDVEGGEFPPAYLVQVVA